MSNPIHTYLFLFNKRLNEYKIVIFILPNKCIQYIISLHKMRNLNNSFLYILFINIIKTTPTKVYLNRNIILKCTFLILSKNM